MQINLDSKLENFLHYANHPSALNSCELPEQIKDWFYQIRKLYAESFNPNHVQKTLCVLQSFPDIGSYIDAPEDEFVPAELADPEFPTSEAPSYYILQAALLFNSALKKKRSLNFEETRKLQQAVYYALSSCSYANLFAHFANYTSPEQEKQRAINGGVARAEKLYGNTKKYVATRFAEIRAVNSRISLSQIAIKIADELEQKPIAVDAPLSNPYDTIYRWVRVLSKNKAAA
jgi:hypothetical protein